MISEEKKLTPMSDTLNPAPPKFGMPWYVILGILTLGVAVSFIPHCRVAGLAMVPAALAFGWWLCKDDPKEPMLILHDLILPAAFDPGKDAK